MSKRINTIEDIFEMANGCAHLAAQLGAHQVTVQGWRKAGIPNRWWDKLFNLYGLTPGELYTVTKKCRTRAKK